MLSKLLTITALSSGFAQLPDEIQADKFGQTYKNYACKLAGMVPDEAAEYHFQLRGELLAQDGQYNVHHPNGRPKNLAYPDGQMLVNSATKECDRMTKVPSCSDLGEDAAPGANCRKLNDGTITPILGGYGCWGTFPTQEELNVEGHAAFYRLVEHGRGKPKDELDRYIRDLTQSYKCIMEESIAQNEGECVPWTEQYMLAFQPLVSGPSYTQWTANCVDNGGDSCNKKACLVETLFAARYSLWTFEQMQSVGGNQMPNDDTTYFHATAAFNKQNDFDGVEPQFVNNDDNCPTGGPVAHVYCCGEYPYRQRLVSADTTTQCCNSQVYNDTTHKCCGDDDNMGGADGVTTPINDAC